MIYKNRKNQNKRSYEDLYEYKSMIIKSKRVKIKKIE